MSVQIFHQVISTVFLWDTTLRNGIQEFPGISRISCQMQCLEDPNCVLFSYDDISLKCSHGDTRVPLSSDVKAAQGTHTYVMFSELCPAGFHLSREAAICYMFHTEQKDWVDARRNCAASGERLAILDTQEKYTAVLRQIRKFTQKWPRRMCFSIGAEKRGQDGKWRWIDGSVVTFSNWRPDHPGTEKGCLNLNPGCQYMWNNAPCHGRAFDFICEHVTSMRNWSSITRH